ncbi:MAG: dihydroorotase [Candidatus Omnitrophota bacterium]
MTILIKNGRVVNPAKNIDTEQDVLIKNSKISTVAKDIKEKADQEIDAKGKIVMPGIVDMHVHLREPGREDKENIQSGTTAALKGGVISVLVMPNTQPAIDSTKNVKLLKELIKNSAQTNVLIAGSITISRRGMELTDITALKKEGVVAITDDGCSVDNEKLLSAAFQKAKQNNILTICHCEDKALSHEGVVNLGIVSTMLGLRGISKESEYKRVERDIKLAEKVGAPIHITHVSCKESVDIIASAKKRGAHVTCETAPHYFSLDDQELLGYNTNLKINPPLRTKIDVEAIREGLKSSVIDVIASDHAPHTENEKDIEFERAEFGTIGLETILAVSIKELIETGYLSWLELTKKLCFNPSKILGQDKGVLQEGAVADIIIVDPEKEWIVKKEDFISKSKNSAFIGKKLKGSVEYTISKGKVVYKK